MALLDAAENDNLDAVTSLLEEGSDVNVKGNECAANESVLC
jgi:hypothetical protein